MNAKFSATYLLDLSDFSIAVFKKVIEIDALPQVGFLISVSSPSWGNQNAGFVVSHISQELGDTHLKQPQFLIWAKPTGQKIDYRDAVSILTKLGWDTP